MSKAKWGLVLFVIVVGSVGVGVYFKNAKNETHLSVKKGSIIDAVYGIGTVTAKNTYALKLGVTSRIQSLSVQEGDEVKAGAPLVALEGLTLFRAPFAGTVTAIPFKVGESVFPQTAIVTMSDLKNLYIVTSLEQQGAIRVKKGQQVRVNFESFRDQNAEGVVKTIFSNDTQFIVHVDVKKFPDQILPGMTADVAIEIDRFKDSILIPATALSGGRVKRIRNNMREEIEVKTGAIDGEWAQILSGDIKETDKVAVGGKK
ncbi:MAG: efflux RND transporter periplasmic adaptor subunit [Xanthomonadaceae bacterium]|nr:efflux RND transporter periplasmic adaptor subunit [Xanthomonadaceae bacterium]